MKTNNIRVVEEQKTGSQTPLTDEQIHQLKLELGETNQDECFCSFSPERVSFSRQEITGTHSHPWVKYNMLGVPSFTSPDGKQKPFVGSGCCVCGNVFISPEQEKEIQERFQKVFESLLSLSSLSWKGLSLGHLRKGLKVKNISTNLVGVVSYVLRYDDHALIQILWEKEKEVDVPCSFFVEPAEGVSTARTEDYEVNRNSFPHLSIVGKDIYIIS